MIDWETVLRDLDEMYAYFIRCAGMRGSETEARFISYTKTLYNITEVIREMLAQEDDGK